MISLHHLFAIERYSCKNKMENSWTISEILNKFSFRSSWHRRHLIVQNQQQKKRNSVWNMFKINNNNIKTILINVILVYLLLILKIFNTFF